MQLLTVLAEYGSSTPLTPERKAIPMHLDWPLGNLPEPLVETSRSLSPLPMGLCCYNCSTEDDRRIEDGSYFNHASSFVRK
jgi:hypothetical protein